MNRTLVLGAMSALNIFSILAFQWLVLTMLGPGNATDALFAAMTIPQIFASVIGVSLTGVLTPLFAGEAEDDQRRDVWTLIILCSIIFVVITAALMATAQWWVRWTVPGFPKDDQALTVRLALISLLGMVFTGLNAVQTAALFAREQYIRADGASAIASVCAVALLPLLIPVYGVYAAAAIATGRLGLQSLLMFRGMGWPRRPEFHRPIVREGWRRLVPLIAGASYYKMDPVVDRILLSSLSPGSLSLFYLAQQLWGAGAQVFGKALGVPAITRMSIAHKRGERSTFRTNLRRTSVFILISSLLVVAGLVAVGQPILRDLLSFGAFGREDSLKLWWLLVFTSGMFVAGTLGGLAAGAAYAVGDTLRPTVLASIAFTIGIALKVTLFLQFGIAGLAIAVSIYYTLSFIILWLNAMRYTKSET